MRKNRLWTLLALVLTMSGCAKQKMPPVPLSESGDHPCASLAPWGFPQVASLRDAASKNARKDLDMIGFICREGQYAVGYDQKLRVPRWALETINRKNWEGNPQRVRKDWRPDPFVPPASSVSVSDYSKEITQGKIGVKSMVPYKDFLNNEVLVGRTFYLSNSAPAIKRDDQDGAWERLEDQVVAWSAQKHGLLVISGTVFANGEPLAWTGHTEKQRRSDPRGVIAVPTHFYKVIVDTANKSAIAFLVPNDDSPASNLPSMAKRVEDVERLAGIQFFPAMNPQDREKIVGKVTVEQWPMQ